MRHLSMVDLAVSLWLVEKDLPTLLLIRRFLKFSIHDKTYYVFVGHLIGDLFEVSMSIVLQKRMYTVNFIFC